MLDRATEPSSIFLLSCSQTSTGSTARRPNVFHTNTNMTIDDVNANSIRPKCQLLCIVTFYPESSPNHKSSVYYNRTWLHICKSPHGRLFLSALQTNSSSLMFLCGAALSGQDNWSTRHTLGFEAPVKFPLFPRYGIISIASVGES